MRRFIAALVVCLVTLGAGTGDPAFAAVPIRLTEILDFTLVAPVTTAACGFPVYHRITGTFTVTVLTGANGAVTHELDGAKDARQTWFAPTKGTSYSFPFNGSTRYDYPQGATAGAPATLTQNQLFEKVPGHWADAGRI